MVVRNGQPQLGMVEVGVPLQDGAESLGNFWVSSDILLMGGNSFLTLAVVDTFFLLFRPCAYVHMLVQ